MSDIKLLSIEEIQNKLNRNRIVDLDNKEKFIVLKDINPNTLVNYKRFDIMAKYIYGWFHEKGLNSDWGYRLYEDHIWVFNKYDEDDGSGKKGIRSFIKSYNRTLESIKNNGFNDIFSLLPIGNYNVLLDGAHRLAAALLYNKKVSVIHITNGEADYSYKFFKQKGLRTKWSDAMAYEYTKLKEHISLVILSPKAFVKRNEIKKIIERDGNIYYEKEIRLTNNGFKNLFAQINEIREVNESYSTTNSIGVLFIESESYSNLSKIKNRIQNNFKYSDHFFYFPKSQEEAMKLSQTLLNENSIFFLNNVSPNKLKKFMSKLNKFNNFLKKLCVDKENFCVVSGAIMEAYGLRESSRIDFIHYGYDSLILAEDDKHFQDRTKDMSYYKKSYDDIIFNPENFFYFNGIKFASLQNVKEMKKVRSLPNDKVDVRLIKRIPRKQDIRSDLDYLHYYIKKRLKIIRLNLITLKYKFKQIIKRS
jgi:hypothetical protein